MLWCLDEDRPADAVMSALQLSTNPYVASLSNVRALTLKAAQLLLADGKSISAQETARLYPRQIPTWFMSH